MKNHLIISFSAIALFLAVAVSLSSCKDESIDRGVHVTNVRLDKTTVVLEFIDDEVELKATVEPDDADNPVIVWSSSDERVVSITVNSIDRTKATIKSLDRAGTATIFVQSEDNEWVARCEVTNKANPVALQGLATLDDFFEIPLGEEASLRVITTPNNATLKSLTWTFIPDIQMDDSDPPRNVNQDQIFYNKWKDPETDPELYEPYYFQYWLDSNTDSDPEVIDFSLVDGEKYFEDFDLKKEVLVQSNVFARYFKLGRIGVMKVVVVDKYDVEKTIIKPVKITLSQPSFEMVDVGATPPGGFKWGSIWIPETGDGGTGMNGIMANITKGYKIGKYTISHKEYLWAMSDQDDADAGTNGFYWRPGNRDNPSHRTYYTLDYPVSGIDWYECQEFIDKLNKKTGRTYRMPTECEWEWAARGATEPPRSWHGGPDECKNACPEWPYGTITCPTYVGSDDKDETYERKFKKGYVANWGGGIDFYIIQDGKRQEMKWMAGKLILRNGSKIQTDKAPTTSGYNFRSFVKSPNWLGAYNMIGNIQEWCSDWYGDPPTGDSVENYSGPPTGTERCMRGGDRDNNGSSTTLYARGHSEPALDAGSKGHRTVRLVVE